MSKMASKTEVLRHKIAREVFGEIDDGDGIKEIPSWEIFEKCLEQHKKIKDLEHRLSKSIEPKFKIGDKCWAIRNATNIYDEPKQILIKEITITKNCIKYYAKNGCKSSLTNKTTMHLQSQLFATEAEAKKHLEELKNG